MVNILNSKIKPESTSQFNTQLNSFKNKKDNNLKFQYLQKLPKGLIKKIFSKI